MYLSVKGECVRSISAYSENAWKLFKHKRRNDAAKSSPNTQKVLTIFKKTMRIWRTHKSSQRILLLRQVTLQCFCISVNNNMNFNKFLSRSIYSIWDGLSLKTISRYFPLRVFQFKPVKCKNAFHNSVPKFERIV
jgi:hypothetical protein